MWPERLRHIAQAWASAAGAVTGLVAVPLALGYATLWAARNTAAVRWAEELLSQPGTHPATRPLLAWAVGMAVFTVLGAIASHRRHRRPPR